MRGIACKPQLHLGHDDRVRGGDQEALDRREVSDESCRAHEPALAYFQVTDRGTQRGVRVFKKLKEGARGLAIHFNGGDEMVAAGAEPGPADESTCCERGVVCIEVIDDSIKEFARDPACKIEGERSQVILSRRK